MPNPVDVKRGEYLQRGTLPLILLAAPLAALAANAPLVAIIAATALLWLLLTLAITPNPSLSARANAAASAKTPIRGFAWRLFPGIWSKPCCWPFPAYCC